MASSSETLEATGMQSRPSSSSSFEAPTHATKYIVFTIGKLPKLPKGFVQSVAPKLGIELTKNISKKCTHLLISEKTKAAALMSVEQEAQVSLKPIPNAHRVAVKKAMSNGATTAIVHEEWFSELCEAHGISVPPASHPIEKKAKRGESLERGDDDDANEKGQAGERQGQQEEGREKGEGGGGGGGTEDASATTLTYAPSLTEEQTPKKSTRGRKPKSPSGKTVKAPRKQPGERKQKKEEIIMVDKPLVDLVIGGAPTEYKSVKIQRTAIDVYRCSCAPYDNATIHPRLRSCRHLAGLLGEGFERHRVYHANLALRPEYPVLDFKEPPVTPGVWPGEGSGLDPTGLLMMPRVPESVPCLWTRHGLYNSQSGAYINAPDWWVAALPRNGTIIQGDLAFLWSCSSSSSFSSSSMSSLSLDEAKEHKETKEGGKQEDARQHKKTRDALLSLCKSTDWSRQAEWKNVRFFAWDLPLLECVLNGDDNKAGSTPPAAVPCVLSQRYEELHRCIILTKSWGPYIELLPHFECLSGLAHAKSTYDMFRAQGYAGLYFRPPRAKYAFEKKSSTLQEFKVFIVEEAKVLGHVAASLVGASNNRVNVLEVMSLKRGVSFNLQLRAQQALNPPAVGSMIRFQYQELDPHTGIPRMPAYVGLASPTGSGGGVGGSGSGGGKGKRRQS